MLGQSDSAYRKAAQVNSDTQLYKQAGNSIVVDVLYYLMKAVFEQNEWYMKKDTLIGIFFFSFDVFPD